MAIKFKRICDLRIDHDLLQREVADILGANKNTYPHWESGLYEFPIEIIDKLSQYYNVSVDYLTGLSNDKGGNLRGYDNKILQKRLRGIREKNNFSQEKIGLIMNGVSQMMLSCYENVVARIPFSSLYIFTKNFEISIDYLMRKCNNPEIVNKCVVKK